MLKLGEEYVNRERTVLGREGKGTRRPTAIDSKEEKKAQIPAYNLPFS